MYVLRTQSGHYISGDKRVKTVEEADHYTRYVDAFNARISPAARALACIGVVEI